MDKMLPRSAIVISLLFLNCGIAETRASAESLIETYFAAAHAGEVERTLALYDAEFYRATSKAEWRDIVASVGQKLGRPTEHALSSWRVTKIAATGGSGVYVVLEYAVTYESGKGTETIGVFIPDATNDPLIRSHHFNSPDLIR